MALVQGSNVILKIANGGSKNPIACNASCALDIQTDFLETTFEETGVSRSFTPNKHTSTLRGSGPIVLGQEVQADTVVLLQLAKTIITWEFSYTDGTLNVVYSGTGFFTSVTIEGPVSQAATCDYNIQVTGGISVTAAPPTGSGTPQVYEYIATGGETTVSDPDLIGTVLLDVEIEGLGFQIITSGTPTPNQVKFTSSTGTLDFGFALMAGTWVNALYIE